jgi:hypothetical protein
MTLVSSFLRESSAVVAILAYTMAMPNGAFAALSAQAKPGDNCTPYNGYAIGYSIGNPPRDFRIVDQRVVLANGWEPYAWILTTRSGSHWLVPYPPYFTGKSEVIHFPVPPLLRLSSVDPESVARAMRRYLNDFSGWRERQLALPSKTLTANCFGRAFAAS